MNCPRRAVMLTKLSWTVKSVRTITMQLISSCARPVHSSQVISGVVWLHSCVIQTCLSGVCGRPGFRHGSRVCLSQALAFRLMKYVSRDTGIGFCQLSFKLTSWQLSDSYCNRKPFLPWPPLMVNHSDMIISCSRNTLKQLFPHLYINHPSRGGHKNQFSYHFTTVWALQSYLWTKCALVF